MELDTSNVLDILLEPLEEVSEMFCGDWSDVSSRSLALFIARPDARQYMTGAAPFDPGDQFFLHHARDRIKMHRAAKLAGFTVQLDKEHNVISFTEIGK